MLLNAELAAQLQIRQLKPMFLHLWGAKEFLLLSSQPSDNAVKVSFRKVNDVYVSTDGIISAVLQAANLFLTSRNRLFLTDIRISGKPPSATIEISNPNGQCYGQIDDHDPYCISDIFPKVSPQKKNHSLLEDAE
jgi:hypothetical protein